MSEEKNEKIGSCHACDGTVSKAAKTCPHCGEKKPYREKGKAGIGTWAVIIFMTFIILGQMGNLFDGSGGTPSVSSSQTSTDLETAMRKCEAGIRASVNNPSTVDIHRFTGFGNDIAADGTRRITQTFSAKNGFGLEQTFDAYCSLKPDGKFDIRIVEQGR